MCDLKLISLIKEYQKGNMTDFDIIYGEFEKLIFSFSRKLDYSDTIQDLNLFFVELLYQISLDRFCNDESGALKKYIAVAIRNRYIALSKIQKIQNDLFTEYCEHLSAINQNFENNIVLLSGLSLLTHKQRRIIVDKYIYGYSDIEISESLHISRQAVNRLKTRGLLILKKYLEDE